MTDLKSQEGIADTVEVQQVIINASKLVSPWLQLPSSATAQSIDESYDGYAKQSLNELLSRQPGIFNQNVNNYAQDLRISIRGFGARSAFGIRGIKLIVDGIPESTPDGQAQVDNLELQDIRTIEILRGPSSGLYGNASGGVINLISNFDVERNFLQLSSVVGSYGTLNQNLKLGLKTGRSELRVSGTHFKTDGYRTHSSSETNLFSIKYQYKDDKNLKVKLSGNYTSSPEALDPGGVNLDSAEENRELARMRNVDFNAGESIKHFKLGATVSKIFNNKKLSVVSYYHNRKFDGRLPFSDGGIIDLDRNFFGQTSNLTFYQGKNKLLVGYDIQLQRDSRLRYVNNLGELESKTLDQIERFENYGFYVVDHLALNQKVKVNLDLRYDKNRLSVEDRFSGSPGNSSARDLDALSYSIGLGYDLKENLLSFLKVSSSFETPTLSELSARESGTGFNEDLKPISSLNYELGLKAQNNMGLYWQGALFFIQSSNEIIPFELADFPGRDFFRNAGSSQRLGLELMVNYEKADKYFVSANYTWSQFQFKDYVKNNIDFKNNKLPGIPTHNFSLTVGYDLPIDFNLQSNNQYVGQLFADDQNDIAVDGYFRSDVKIAKTLTINNWSTRLYFGVNNILGQKYFDNIRINAFGGRYYEPAPERNYYLGLKLRIE